MSLDTFDQFGVCVEVTVPFWCRERRDSPMTETAKLHAEHQRQHFVLNIEGHDHAWLAPTIYLDQIRYLAGWDPTQAVVEVDLSTNEEHTLTEHTPIQVQAGAGFARKIKFKRGCR
jgi:hypothetical protein